MSLKCLQPSFEGLVALVLTHAPMHPLLVSLSPTAFELQQQTEHMQEVPTRLDKDKLKDFSQLDLREKVSCCLRCYNSVFVLVCLFVVVQVTAC